jgi:hypothetical protein
MGVKERTEPSFWRAPGVRIAARPSMHIRLVQDRRARKVLATDPFRRGGLPGA